MGGRKTARRRLDVSGKCPIFRVGSFWFSQRTGGVAPRTDAIPSDGPSSWMEGKMDNERKWEEEARNLLSKVRAMGKDEALKLLNRMKGELEEARRKEEARILLKKLVPDERSFRDQLQGQGCLHSVIKEALRKACDVRPLDKHPYDNSSFCEPLCHTPLLLMAEGCFLLCLFLAHQVRHGHP